MHMHSFTARPGCTILELEAVDFPAQAGETSQEAVGKEGETQAAPAVGGSGEPFPPESLLGLMQVQRLLDREPGAATTVSMKVGVDFRAGWLNTHGLNRINSLAHKLGQIFLYFEQALERGPEGPYHCRPVFC